MKVFHQSVFERWPFEDKSIQSICTSPPYYGLRKYLIQDVMIGGREDCNHEWEVHSHKKTKTKGGTISEKTKEGQRGWESESKTCRLCSLYFGQYGLEPSYKLYLEHTMLWLKEAWRVLRDDGILFLNIGDGYNNQSAQIGRQDKSKYGGKSGLHCLRGGTKNLPPKSKFLIPERLIVMIADTGWIVRNHIVWYKNNSMPESVMDRFTKKWESIIFVSKSSNTKCWKHKKTEQWTWEKPEPEYYILNGKRKNYWEGYDYYFDMDAVREPHKQVSIERLNRAVSNKNKWVNGAEGQRKQGLSQPRENRNYKGGGNKSREQNLSNIGSGYQGGDYLVANLNPKGKNPGDVWSISTQASPLKHYAMWPGALCKRLILCSTKPGDIVLDPFCGSGTTLRVADELNRVAYGIDLGYQDIQRRRLTEIQKELI